MPNCQLLLDGGPSGFSFAMNGASVDGFNGNWVLPVGANCGWYLPGSTVWTLDVLDPDVLLIGVFGTSIVNYRIARGAWNGSTPITLDLVLFAPAWAVFPPTVTVYPGPIPVPPRVPAPIPCGCDCACNACANRPAAPAAPLLTNSPVRYATGEVALSAEDLEARGFGVHGGIPAPTPARACPPPTPATALTGR